MRNVALIIPLLVQSLLVISCKSGNESVISENGLTLSAVISKAPPAEAEPVDYGQYAHLKVPPLSPEKALETFTLEEGFRIELVAHEPMIVDPIAMDVDVDGRLWVIDMPSYMPVHDKDVLETSGLERIPVARVVVLEDSNDDGRTDVHRVFFDGLVLPRAIKVLCNGILVAEPPNVWFIRDTTGDGRGDTKERVYDRYGDNADPNIHSYPGGLMWGMDNWLHSSNDDVESIRLINGQWKTLPFQRLGQWGMSQDNWGRLYSSNNARPLQAHLVPYGYSRRHPFFKVTSGKNVSLGGDTLWPAHPTGVNRGYRKGVLRDDGTLIQATAASGTVIYRGDQFGKEYVGNAFSPEPGANLIKRYIIDDDPAKIEAKARYAYVGREFLTSTDERFRPVNIYNSPDGGLYVVDMYRGLLEHASHLTEYLRSYAVARDLHIPTGKFGRIYRIVKKGRDVDYQTPELSKMKPQAWVDLLRHENGMLRDHAQQVLVQCSPPEAVPLLNRLTTDSSVQAFTRLHALWALEGFDTTVYAPDQLVTTAIRCLNDVHPRVRAAAVRVLEPAISGGVKSVEARLAQLAHNESSAFVRLQLLASLGEARNDSAVEIMASILDRHMDSPYFREMALTGLYRREKVMERILRTKYKWGEKADDGRSFLSSLSEAAKKESEIDLIHLNDRQRKLFENGKKQFNTCKACHGSEGQGLDGIGPPLAGSYWVNRYPEIAVRIVLHGFAGGAADRGENITGVMPGHGYLADQDIAAVLTYIRLSWGNNSAPVTPETVARIRKETQDRSDTWSPGELAKIKKPE